ncbi:GNAT family N-acetyltransferase [Nonomuraea africana]|nr:GNAT family N-acetyltransferase [Nonomuraea africana]MBE1563818.1 GNAT superfamily N-acetyltransferase [Nonomuraea africana]
MQEFTIERLRTGDEDRLREIRLRALADAPTAFGATYDKEAAHPRDKWAERLADPDAAWFVAAGAGLVCAKQEREGEAHLQSMWVAPEARGTGLAGRLVDEVVAWSRTRDAYEIGLWAVDDNLGARALYARKGFLPSGEVMALPSHPELMESRYVLSLVFRTAGADDLPAIVALITDDAIAAARTGAYGPEHVAAFEDIEADPNNELIVAELKGEVVGTMQLTYIPGISRLGATRLQVEAVRIAGHLRGQGWGRRMMEWAHAKGRARGCAMVQLTSDKRREDAHRFYRSLGYAQSHEGFKLQLD